MLVLYLCLEALIRVFQGNFCAAYDIYDDCVRRYVNDSQTKSDAVVCAQLCPICPARGWGVVWLVISMGLWAVGVCYLVLHVGGHLDL